MSATIKEKYLQRLMDEQGVTRECAEQQWNKNDELWEAARKGDQQSVKSALSKGAHINFKHPSWNEQTPLHAATANRHEAIVKLLLMNGAKPSITDKYHITPLHKAYCNNSEDKAIIELLDPQGCDLQQIKKDMQLLEASSTDELKKALANGGSVHVGHPKKGCKTPLHLAAERGSTEQLDILISASANINSKDGSEQTALHVAAANRHINIMELLLKRGADPNLTDVWGFTPLHMACTACDTDAINCLLNNPKVNALSLNYEQQIAIEYIPLKHKKKLQFLKLFQPFIPDRKKLQVDAFPKVFLCGDTTAGKSSLLEVIKCHADGSSGRYGDSECVQNVVLQTAGIVYFPLDKPSTNYIPKMTIIDLAGHHEYISSHTAVLENIISSEVFLVVSNLMDDIDTFEKKLYYWFQFIENACLNLDKPSIVIVIGSHFDLFKGDIDQIHNIVSSAASSALPRQKYWGFLPMDCHRPGGVGVEEFLEVLKENCEAVVDTKNKIPYKCHTLYAFLRTIKRVAINVQELLALVKDENESCLPTDESTVREFLVTLEDKGMILFLKSAGWIIIDEAALLKDVNGVLFNKSITRVSKPTSSNTGIIPVTSLAQMFPNYNIDMLVGFLVSMEFCHVVHTEALSEISTNIQQSTDKSEQLLYFPALVSVERPALNSSIFVSGIGWCLFCPNLPEFLSTRFLEVLLHRCAYSHALKLDSQGRVKRNPAVQNLDRSCNVWKNGIHWQRDGSDYVVEVLDHYRLVKVIVSQRNGNEDLRDISSLVYEILELIKKYCPYCDFEEYLISPSQLGEALTCNDLHNLTKYNIRDVARACVLNKCVQDGSKIEEILAKQEPYLYLAPVVIRELFIEEKAELRLTDKAIEHVRKCCRKLAKRRSSLLTHRFVRDTLNQFSLFAGRNPLTLAYPEIPDADVESNSIEYLQSMSPSVGRDTVPEKLDVLKLLSDINHRWYEIGDCLKVKTCDLEALKESNESPERKLSHVLQKWIDQMSTPVTWNTIMTTVSGPIIKNNSVYSKIVQFLEDQKTTSDSTMVDLSEFIQSAETDSNNDRVTEYVSRLQMISGRSAYSSMSMDSSDNESVSDMKDTDPLTDKRFPHVSKLQSAMSACSSISVDSDYESVIGEMKDTDQVAVKDLKKCFPRHFSRLQSAMSAYSSISVDSDYEFVGDTDQLTVKDLKKCSRHIRRDLKEFAGFLNITDEFYKTVVEKYETVTVQAYHIMKEWMAASVREGGTADRQELIDTLEVLEYTEAVKILQSNQN